MSKRWLMRGYKGTFCQAKVFALACWGACSSCVKPSLAAVAPARRDSKMASTKPVTRMAWHDAMKIDVLSNTRKVAITI